MTDDEHVQEVEVLLRKVRQTCESAKKLVRLARAADNVFALKPAMIAVEMGEQATDCLEAARAAGRRCDASANHLNAALLARDECQKNIDEALKALTRI